MPLITCRDLELSYDGRKVLTGLSFTLDAGDYLCIIGENGSGKSSLMKALLTLKAPDSGEIIFGDGLLRREIGYLPQRSGIQSDFPASVWEVVLSGCLNSEGVRPFHSKEARQQAEENLQKLGISELKRCSYRDLSGGQQQRVLLARALCSAKKLILLDEPVAGLDPVASGDMYSAIARLNEGGMSVIMVSHDIAGAVKYASHILHLHHEPLFFGTRDDYLRSDIGHRFTGDIE